MKKGNGSAGTGRVETGGILSIVFLLLLLFVFSPPKDTLHSVQAMEQYMRCYRDPLVVTAVVAEHSETEDIDGDLWYESYVVYEAGGKDHRIRYESSRNQASLTPVGETVTLEVSREMPYVPINDLKEEGGGTLFWNFLMYAAVLALLWKLLLQRKLCNCTDLPDQETIWHDALIKICARFRSAFCLLPALGFAWLSYRYPPVYGGTMWSIPVVCALIWLYFQIKGAAILRKVRNGCYDVSRDTLYHKYTEDDGDGHDLYVLCYQSGERKWETNTRRKEYEAREIGDTVFAVYLPGDKHPFLIYEQQDDACRES